MGQDLKAENLTISLPNRGCDKNCPYCVSRMTGYIDANVELMERNIEKVINVAEAADVTSILFTGKGEPMMNPADINRFAYKLKRRWPLELQTNGMKLAEDIQRIDWLYAVPGIDVLAVSMDCPEQFHAYTRIFKRAKELGMITRITVNITDRLGLGFSFYQLINYCAENDVRQLTFRKIISPEVTHDLKAMKWIGEHAPDTMYNALIKEAVDVVQKDGRLIRQLANGINIYDINDVSFSYSDYCIQERSLGNNVRSLVFQEDGHLYTSWGSRASVLF